MNKTRTKIYLNIDREKNEAIYSGIGFADFIKYLPIPIENILLLKGDFWGNNHKFGFELFEGQQQVAALMEEDIYNAGDFSFVDYSKEGNLASLDGQQIAELLYFAHMGKTLGSPFFGVLQNRFTYLSHDDGWYCKLYCRDFSEFMAVLCGKIAGFKDISLSDSVRNQLLQLAQGGIIIDLDEMTGGKKYAGLQVYTVGKHLDFDFVMNNFQNLKENPLQINMLSFIE